MSIAYAENYRTQQELALAYRRLGHQATVNTWSATLLIHRGLTMSWACPVLLHEPDPELGDTRIGWHVIAEAGDLDYPPLRPEEEIWPALLAAHPTPTGEHAEQQARMLGKTVEEAHHDHLRRHFLSDANIGFGKRNPTDVNFDPLVRDWDVTARQLAEFRDTHKPPKLTTEQRVMSKGAELATLEAEVDAAKVSLARLMRNAAQEQGDKPRYGFKADLHRWSGRARPTVEAWLNANGLCEAPVPSTDTED
ncbi:hypothetical protein ABZ905_08870 [Streptomyces parvus]|uniref:hypothetical protein n=1 Tax=Streptomyces parvus TaxID=66428 RepID=UPI0033FA0B6A